MVLPVEPDVVEGVVVDPDVVPPDVVEVLVTPEVVELPLVVVVVVEVPFPDVEFPDVEFPDVELPEVELPDVELPELELVAPPLDDAEPPLEVEELADVEEPLSSLMFAAPWLMPTRTLAPRTSAEAPMPRPTTHRISAYSEADAPRWSKP